jgi:glycosyltransferase involved in cell wall biosynthesis
MKLLFCCESYWPHRGGVQEVIRQIAERMVLAGHEVSVAARAHPDRKMVDVYNGVRIHSFEVRGSLVAGIRGEADRYRKFVRDFAGDAILIKAAQQWSFDALWPVLDQIKARKVFVPCGFSGLYEPSFSDYFRQIPEILRKFDHLVFYAERYRDIDFAKANGITNFSIIPNGASEIEFGRESRQRGNLREELGIPESDLVLLTVGAPTAAKGHETLAEAFAQVDTSGRGATLILNGDWPAYQFNAKRIGTAMRHLGNMDSLRRGVLLLQEAGVSGLVRRMFPRLPNGRGGLAAAPLIAPSEATAGSTGTRGPARKKMLPVDLPREKVVDAFFEADLFVFASKVEYSPLVLFEAAAAGTPFLTVPAGNADEIVHWTGGGWLCPAEVDDRGYVKVSPSVLAREIEKGIGSPDRLRELGENGRQAWRERFTWNRIAGLYECVLRGGRVASPLPSEMVEAAQGAPGRGSRLLQSGE